MKILTGQSIENGKLRIENNKTK